LTTVWLSIKGKGIRSFDAGVSIVRSQAQLFQNLLEIEIKHRLRQSEGLSSSEYHKRFPKYAAPEQMFGERSEASDWYAVGVMLFEALTGQPPFLGNQMELLRQKQNEDPASLAEREGLPPDLAKQRSLFSQETKVV
jgi:serine/threonine protein kinase